MKKIIIGGCSFSESQIGNESEWVPWSDLFYKNYSKKFDIINVAKSSFGQSLIVESITNELIKNNFDVDYVIIQWSAVSRSYFLNENEIVKSIIQDDETAQFASNLHEYSMFEKNKRGATDIMHQVDYSFYKTSLTKIFLLKSLLDLKKIPYTMFWGWEQINSEIEKEFKSLINLIYDENFWRFKKHGGMSELILNTMSERIGLADDDNHPSSIGQKFFYDEIIKNIIIEKISP